MYNKCYFCRSKIQGRGLFCKKTIETGDMIIEYSGEKIRSVLTDKREDYYEKKVGGDNFTTSFP